MDFSTFSKDKFPTYSKLRTTEVFRETYSLTPSFYLCKGNDIVQYSIPDRKQLFKIGRSKTCDIVVDDNSVSNEQVAIVKLGEMCYFMDCGSQDKVSFNGVRQRQVAIPTEGRMVMKIGNLIRIVYVGINYESYPKLSDTMLIRKSLGIDMTSKERFEGEIFFNSHYGEWLTHSSAILIGSL